MIFDTHAHYDSPAFDEDREELLASLADAGVGHVTNICCSLSTLASTRALTERYDWIFGAAGIHPEYVGELTEDNFHKVWETAVLPKFVAVGEIGLDYHEEHAPAREVQKIWFRQQLALARELGKPVVIHSRDAAKDTLDLMRECRAEEIGGVIHCFSYPREVAREFLAMGFYLGVGGVSTYPNARKIREVIASAPMERIVLETDSPFLTPAPHRGERNSSRNIPLVAEAIAGIRGITPDEVIRLTEENAYRLFRIPRGR